MAGLVPVPRQQTPLDSILNFGKGLVEKAAETGRQFRMGYTTGERLLHSKTPTGYTVFSPKYYQELGAGAPAQSYTQYVKNVETGAYTPQTKVEFARPPISPSQNPAAFAGAYTARVIADLGLDETRNKMYQVRHPMWVTQEAIKSTLKSKGVEVTPVQEGIMRLATFTPIIASTNVINFLNPGQLFRPTGFAQQYPNTETGDKRESTQPGQELFDRFFLQHQGRALPYEQAKQEIPNLTPQQYANYQRYSYQDKGLLDLGLVKGTMQNLQGYPEIKIANFPITVPAVAAAVGGNLGLKYALKAEKSPMRIAGAGFGGALAGAAVGNVINEVIAMANRPKLPTLQQYQTQPGATPLDLSQQGIG